MMRTGSMRRVALPCSVAAGLAAAAFAQAAVDVDLQPRQLADTAAGSASGMSSAATFAAAGGQAFFRAAGSTSGVYQLWRSSGRPQGTYPIPGTEGISSDPIQIPGTSTVLFYSGTGTLRALKAYDAASKGLTQVSAGAMAAVATSITAPGTNAPTQGFVFAGGHAAFIAPIGGVNALWVTDGTIEGTGPVSDPALGTIGNITPADHSIYFTTRSATNVYTLWRTDGTPMNPTRISDLRSAPTWSIDSSGMRSIGDGVLFSQTVTNNTTLSEVWVSDGTAAGTHSVAQTPVQSSVLAFANDGAGLFSTRLTSTAMEMWRMSSNPSECVNLMNFARNTRFMGFGSYGSMSLFGDTGGGSQYNTTTNNAVTIWVTDGTPQNTLGIPNFPGAPVTTSQNGAPPSVMSGNTLYIDAGVGAAGHEPWSVNLSTGAITLLRDAMPGGASSNPTKFFPLDTFGAAGFFAYDTPGHYALYTSDGTSTGTRMVSRLAGVTYQYAPKSVGSRVFLVGGIVNGFEPYVVDLCPADYDNSGSVTTQDLFTYLNDWFLASPEANMDSTAGAPDMNDLMSFFNTWLTPCGS